MSWPAQDRLGAAIDAVNLPDLLGELCPGPQTAGLSRERGGTICDPRPGREERRPSFSVSRPGGRWLWHRFGTDEGGSAFELLVSLGWSRGGAAAELVRRAGLKAPIQPRPRPDWPGRSLLDQAKEARARWRELDGREQARVRWLVGPLDRHGAAELRRRGVWPPAPLLAGTVRREVRAGPDGPLLVRAGALAFALHSPAGRVVGWKARNLDPLEREGERAGRYAFLTPGHGAPPWVSPGYGRAGAVLLVEGDLNGVAAHRALGAVGRGLDVQGLAGVAGWLHLGGLEGRPVFVLADAGGPGDRARARWRELARRAGAARVRVLEPLPEGRDCCELAGRDGLEALGSRLATALSG